MTKRIALFVSAMSTGIALATTSISAVSAADECLAKPKGLAPAGKHWYYSTDRKLQRKCWYLDDAGEKIVTPRRASSRSRSPALRPRTLPRRRTRLPRMWMRAPS